jgi:hypothetical protein
MKITKTFIYFSLLLTALYLIQWWLLFYYFTNVPKYIPDTPINIYGVILALTVLPVIYFFLKTALKKDPAATILQLTGLGTLLAIVTEILFQIVRQTSAAISLSEKISETLYALSVATWIIGAISFMTAFKLKNPKSIWNTIFLVLFFAIIYLVKKYTSIIN